MPDDTASRIAPADRPWSRPSRAQAGGRRVLIVVQNLPVPFDRRVWLEATTLQRAGYSVSVICPKAKGFNASHEEREGVAIYRYALPIDATTKLGFIVEFAWCFAMTALLSVRVALFGRGFDILHICNPPETYWPLAWLWRRLGKVFIFDHHDLSPEMYQAKFGGGGLYLKLLYHFERLTFAVAQVVITTNDSHKRIAISRGGKHPGEVYVVRSGPELSRFARHPADTSWRRGKAHLLVYLGEICKQDGVDHLVRAVKLVIERHGTADLHCVVVGGGPHQPSIKAYAAEMGVAAYFTFTGRVDDDSLCRILSSADIAVDPGPKNPWSDKSTMNKIIEYMYFGLPIVCYETTEARVSARDAALYVEPNNEDALARGITGLLDDPAARDQMGRYGEERVRSVLAWDHSVPHLIAAYEHAGLCRQGRSAMLADLPGNRR
jgi:glycosyltransferase involved in cell wall biosynthesis